MYEIFLWRALRDDSKNGCVADYHLNTVSRKSLEIQAYSIAKPRTLLKRKLVWKFVFSCSDTSWKWNLGRIDSFVVWILVTSSENRQDGINTMNSPWIRVFHKEGFALTLVMKVRVRLFGCPVLELLCTHHPPIQGFEKEKVGYTEDC